MKTNKFFMGLFAIIALVFLGACNPGGEKNPPVVITIEGAPEIAPATDGGYTIAIRFNDVPCNDVVFMGHYALKDGTEVNWSADNAVKMTQVEGTKTWWQCVVYPVADGDLKAYISGKPVQLQGDGSFDWGGQPALNGLKLLDGTDGQARMFSENGGEYQFRLYTTEEDVATAIAAEEADPSADNPIADIVLASQVIWAESTGWKVDPCVVEDPATEAWIKHASDDAEIAWTPQQMTKVADATFTYELVYKENGFNIGATDACDGWYPVEKIEGLDEETMAGKTIVVTFVSESGSKGKVSVKEK